MKRHIKIGYIQVPLTRGVGYRPAWIYCTIEFANGRLSITGVEGPLSNGNALGGCGQIYREKAEDRARIKPADGYTPELIGKFFDVWRRWHLNDMRPGCEHQTGAAWNSSKELTLYYFRLKKEIAAEIREAEETAKASIKSGQAFTPTERQTILANLPRKITREAAELSEAEAEYYTANGPQYSGDNYNRASETKTAGWVYPKDHSLGLLGKPCETCGYKYGTAWKREDVPTDVLEFLASLPSNDGDAMPSCWLK